MPRRNEGERAIWSSVKQTLRAAVEGLFVREPPVYAQTLFWVVLGCAYWLSFGEPNYFMEGEKGDAVTYLSWLPQSIVRNHDVYVVFKWLFGAFGLLWLFQIGLPYSAWLATFCFTTQISLFQENIRYHDHIFQVTNQLLLVHCIWHHFCAREIKQGLRRARFWESAVAPRWVFYLCVFYVAVYYAFVGWHKVWVSGLDWINGTSLQLWIHSWGRTDFFPNSWILENRALAKGLQGFTLFTECFAFLGLFHCRLRYVMGLALTIFHVGQEWLFNFDFGSNLVLVAYLYLPFDTTLQTLKRRLSTNRLRLNSKAARWLFARFDFLSLTSA